MARRDKQRSSGTRSPRIQRFLFVASVSSLAAVALVLDRVVLPHGAEPYEELGVELPTVVSLGFEIESLLHANPLPIFGALAALAILGCLGVFDRLLKSGLVVVLLVLLVVGGVTANTWHATHQIHEAVEQASVE